MDIATIPVPPDVMNWLPAATTIVEMAFLFREKTKMIDP
jgi:hypothetical protein